MSEELRPCPFCGGEATIRRKDDVWIVECRHHGWSSKDDDGCRYAGDISLYVEISGKVNHWTHEIGYAEKDIDLAKKKAIEAWNRRAERTCRMEQDPDYDFVRCSACGYEEESNILVAVDEGGLVVYDGNYCPNCGAKVVIDDADR